MQAAMLPERGVVAVEGPDARKFLQGLVTNDVLSLGADETRWAALLTPQGKILFDFMMAVAPEGVYLDCQRAQVPELVKRLNLYVLRSAVRVCDVSDTFQVIALFGGGAVGEGARDTRCEPIGSRLIAPISQRGGVLWTFGGKGDPSAYEALRIRCGVPQGGLDFVYGDAFPHEANMDLLHGVSFDKGCYVGQEVVSRMQNRGLTRKRVTRILYDGPAPVLGTPVIAGTIGVGFIGSTLNGAGLAMLRLDRIEEAEQMGVPLTSGAAILRRA